MASMQMPYLSYAGARKAVLGSGGSLVAMFERSVSLLGRRRTVAKRLRRSALQTQLGRIADRLLLGEEWHAGAKGTPHASKIKIRREEQRNSSRGLRLGANKCENGCLPTEWCPHTKFGRSVAL